MSKYMRQVNKDEFEILTRFHPGEVRYYVDVGKAVNRNKGAKVSVKRKPIAASKLPQSGSRPVKYVQVTTKRPGNMRPDSIQYNVYASCTSILANDPTQVMARKELTDQVSKALPAYSRLSQIVPSISSLIKLDQLRYAGAPSA